MDEVFGDSPEKNRKKSGKKHRRRVRDDEDPQSWVNGLTCKTYSYRQSLCHVMQYYGVFCKSEGKLSGTSSRHFVMLYRVLVTFWSVYEILKCDYSARFPSFTTLIISLFIKFQRGFYILRPFVACGKLDQIFHLHHSLITMTHLVQLMWSQLDDWIKV